MRKVKDLLETLKVNLEFYFRENPKNTMREFCSYIRNGVKVIEILDGYESYIFEYKDKEYAVLNSYGQEDSWEDYGIERDLVIVSNKCAYILTKFLDYDEIKCDEIPFRQKIELNKLGGKRAYYYFHNLKSLKLNYGIGLTSGYIDFSNNKLSPEAIDLNETKLLNNFIKNVCIGIASKYILNIENKKISNLLDRNNTNFSVNNGWSEFINEFRKIDAKASNNIWGSISVDEIKLDELDKILKDIQIIRTLSSQKTKIQIYFDLVDFSLYTYDVQDKELDVEKFGEFSELYSEVNKFKEEYDKVTMKSEITLDDNIYSYLEYKLIDIDELEKEIHKFVQKLKKHK